MSRYFKEFYNILIGELVFYLFERELVLFIDILIYG